MLGQQGELEQAMTEWRAILERDRDHRDALYSMGLAWFRLQRFDRASHWFEQVLQGNPEDAPALENLANALTNLGVERDRQGNVDEAVALWRRALQLQPDHPVARANLERRTGR